MVITESEHTQEGARLCRSRIHFAFTLRTPPMVARSSRADLARHTGVHTWRAAVAMPREPRQYLSYLVRLWDEGSRDASCWRASLEEPGSGERRGFADLASLFTFLEEQTYVDAPRDTTTTVPSEER